ncbi:hypothetical protein MARVELLAND_109 [Bacillus phage vB_BspM_MarvelLand]|nr:hypothetical protein MARVELLAND_109 [Bacillus phage vB_BspM_MarvelLand]
MKTTLKVPDKLKIGFQGGRDTYDGQLAYIIYWDEKGVLRKETSWESWRHKNIEPIEVDNVPTSGLVLNKRAGGYSTGWNHRDSYVRVYDPRGFEIEITIPNLLFILENCVCNKGKGLEGEFVYAWDNTKLVLLPVDSPDYKEIIEYNTMVKEDLFVKPKELKPGFTYITTSGKEEVFLGKHHHWDSWSKKKKSAKHFYFGYISTDDNGEQKVSVTATSKIDKRFVRAASEVPHERYADMIDVMEGWECYSPIDTKAYKYKSMSIEELSALIDKRKAEGYYAYVYVTQGEYKNIEVKIHKEAKYDRPHWHSDKQIIGYTYTVSFWDQDRLYPRRDMEIFTGSLDKLYDELQPSVQRKVFLANGNFLRKEKA